MQLNVKNIRYIGIKITIRKFYYFILSDIVVDKFMKEPESNVAFPNSIATFLRSNRI